MPQAPLQVAMPFAGGAHFTHVAPQKLTSLLA
jgi:hypothetical protein